MVVNLGISTQIKGLHRMNPRLLAIAALAASSLVLSACGKSNSPEAANPAQPAAAAPQAPASQGAEAPAASAHAPTAVGGAEVKADKLVIQGLASQIPAGWTPTPLSSTMRVAQFGLPAAAGAEPGEVAVYFFPVGQGGTQEANIERWASQFTAVDGKPAPPITSKSKSKSGDMEVTLVELHGSYARGVGMGPGGDAKPDQTLMVAMTEAPAGRITMQMYGPNKTVAAQRDNFIKLAKGFRPA
jgi:hypothetical protein